MGWDSLLLIPVQAGIQLRRRHPRVGGDPPPLLLKGGRPWRHLTSATFRTIFLPADSSDTR